MRNLWKRKKEKRAAMIHLAKRAMFVVDSLIDSAEIGSEITTREVQETARQFFNLELNDKAATLALVTRLEQRGYLVSDQNMRSMKA
ncbi:hypothetical protein [Streptomyces sp. NPDC055607]